MLTIGEIAILTEIANRHSCGYKNVAHYTDEAEIEKVNAKVVDDNYFADDDCGAEVFTCRSGDFLYFHFLGTNEKLDWKHNLDVIPYPFLIDDVTENTTKLRVHRGIYFQFLALFDFVMETLTEHRPEHFVFCGHSLGGALATLTGMYFASKGMVAKIHVITIGAPPVFNDEATWVYNTLLAKRTFRIVNHMDSIPHMNLAGYVHTDAILFYFKNKMILFVEPKRTLKDRVRSLRKRWTNHSIAVYIDNLKLFPFIENTELSGKC